MNNDLLNALLEKLQSGDEHAVEEIFRRYEPFLRMIVRRKMTPALRAKFDSADVVQSIWADLYHGFRDGRWDFSDSRQLQAFLVRAASNRLIDAVRRNNQDVRSAARDVPIEEIAQPAPRPSEVAAASDTWDELLSLCAPEHRVMVDLKRQGVSLDEIASRTGFHKSSVRRILYELARRLEQKRRRSGGPSVFPQVEHD